MSDFRIAFDESFRFETLIGTLRLPELSNGIESDGETSYGSEQDGIWEARTAAMTLINAITNCPESLEERIMLREELGRRGLNEIIVVCPSYVRSSSLGPLVLTSCEGLEICQATGYRANPIRCIYRREVRR